MGGSFREGAGTCGACPLPQLDFFRALPRCKAILLEKIALKLSKSGGRPILMAG
jgi:hypothetical protein